MGLILVSWGAKGGKFKLWGILNLRLILILSSCRKRAKKKISGVLVSNFETYTRYS